MPCLIISGAKPDSHFFIFYEEQSHSFTLCPNAANFRASIIFGMFNPIIHTYHTIIITLD